MANEITTTAIPEATIAALDKAAEAGALVQTAATEFARIFATANCIEELRKLLTHEVMRPIMLLQNSPVGFLTDRRDTGYDEETVRCAIIEAAINRVSVCGNEMNIIAGRFYCAKNGLKHKLRNIDGLYYNVTPGIPKLCGEQGAIIRMRIEWTYHAPQKEKEIDFAIRVNKGMGADAIVGKATRKALAWLYEEVTGNTVPEGEAGDVVIIDTPAVTPPKSGAEKIAEKLAKTRENLI